MNHQCLLILSFGIILWGCSNTAPPDRTIRICDDSGCSNRPANSASYDPSAAVPNPDPEGRIPALEELARQDPRAAYDLGLRYFRGDGIRKDTYKALQWMRDAAERGNFDAQKAVGRFYLTGLEEMGSDPQEAEKWLQIAADRGDHESLQLLEEAKHAKQSDQLYNRRLNDWRSAFYGYWYSGYSYGYRWRHGRWRYYR
jgi:TPR repeat protein